MQRKGRKGPNLTEKLAAACLQLAVSSGWDLGKTRKELWAMTAPQILALFECQHETMVVHGGTSHPLHLSMLPKPMHRQITAERDIPRAAKAQRLHEQIPAVKERIESNEARFRAVLGIPNPRPKKKMQSRGFQGHRRFDGTVVLKRTRSGNDN